MAYEDLIDPFADWGRDQRKTQDDWTKSYNEMSGWAMPVEDSSYLDQQNEVNLDPFQDFKFGMNMPTFGLIKGGLDTGAGLFNAFNKFREFGLREDMFDEQKRLAERDYLDAKGLRNIKFDKMDYNRAERNNFKQAYGGPEGNYIMEDPVNRRSLAV